MAAVIIDTTEFFKSLRLRGAGWPEVLAWSRRGLIRVAAPEVVVREAVRHFKRQQEGATRKLKEAASAFDALGTDALALPDLDALAQGRVDGYQDWLRSALAANGVVVLPLPNVPHDAVVERDLAERKPFRPAGKGYRDALIWETILEYAENTPAGEVDFVTSNADDFGGPVEALDEGLKAEAAARGCSVRRLDTLKELVAERLDEVVETLAFEELDEEHAREAVVEAVMQAAAELVGTDIDMWDEGRSQFTLAEFGLPVVLDGASIEYIEPDPDTVEVDVYDTYAGDTLAIHVDIEASILIDAFAYKSDYYTELLRDGDVLDADWNDHMVLVQYERRATLHFYVTTVRGGVEDIAFDSLDVAVPSG